MRAAPFPFSVVLEPIGDRLVVGVLGDIDLATALSIDGAVDGAIHDGWRRIVLDLRRVGFMDSTGVHLFRRLRARTLPGSRIEVTGACPEVERVMAFAGLSDVLPRAEPDRLTASTFAERVLEVRRSLDLQPSA